MNLNFSMSELIQSDTAIKNKINNMPDINSLDYMLELIIFVLQPLREKLKKPIIITSGYRCKEVNTLVGGAVDNFGNPKSQHCRGQAADIKVNGMTARALYEFIKYSNIEYDQLILESSWVHISYDKGKNRKQNLEIL